MQLNKAVAALNLTEYAFGDANGTCSDAGVVSVAASLTSRSSPGPGYPAHGLALVEDDLWRRAARIDRGLASRVPLALPRLPSR